MMNFSEALKRLKLGAKLHRQSWAKGEYLMLIDNAFRFKHREMPDPLGWIIGAEDILAEDWIDPAE